MRLCQARNCDREARRRGKLCGACSMRQFRANNRERCRANERARVFTAEQQVLRNARATVAVNVRRSRLARELCKVCGRTAYPYHPNLTRRLDIVWLCRPHRQQARERDQVRREDLGRRAARLDRQAHFTSLRERFEREWPLITEAEKLSVQALALISLAMQGLSLESPLGKQALVRAYGEWIDGA